MRFVPSPGAPRFAFGELLAQARTDAGYAQTQLAAAAGVTQAEISLYESGGRTPSLDKAAHLLGILGWHFTARRAAPTDGLRLGRTTTGLMHHWAPHDGPLILTGDPQAGQDYLELIAAASPEQMPPVITATSEHDLRTHVQQRTPAIIRGPRGSDLTQWGDTFVLDVRSGGIHLRSGGYRAILRWPTRNAA